MGEGAGARARGGVAYASSRGRRGIIADKNPEQNTIRDLYGEHFDAGTTRENRADEPPVTISLYACEEILVEQHRIFLNGALTRHHVADTPLPPRHHPNVGVQRIPLMQAKPRPLHIAAYRVPRHPPAPSLARLSIDPTP